MATTASISRYQNNAITFYETITNFNSAPTNDDVLISISPTWNTVDAVANTPIVTLASPNAGAGSSTVVLRNIHNPEFAQDAATKNYVDSLTIVGVSWKNTCKVATTANIAVFPPTDGLTTVSALDGLTLAVGNRVLVKDQTTATQNGIYTVTAGTWTRSLDMPVSATSSGFAVWVDTGSIWGDTGFVVTSDAPTDVVGTDPIVWAKFSSTPGVDGTNGDLQFVVDGAHAHATVGTLNWSVANAALTIAGDNSAQDALIISLGDINLTEGDVKLADSAFVSLGASGDLTLSHNGTNSFITNTTGILTLANSSATQGIVYKLGDAAGVTSFAFRNSADTDLVTMNSSGTMVHVTGSHRYNDSVNLLVGTGSDLTIVHDGTDTNMTNATGILRINQTAAADLIVENSNTSVGSDLTFKLGASTTGSSFSFIGDSAGAANTMVQVLAASQESTSTSTGTLRVVGGIASTGNVSAITFNTLSDATTKTNISAMSDPLEKLKQIEGYEYNFLPGYGQTDKLHSGVLAQQIESIQGLEHCVTTDIESGYKSVNYLYLVPLLIEAVKELSAKLDRV